MRGTRLGAGLAHFTGLAWLIPNFSLSFCCVYIRRQAGSFVEISVEVTGISAGPACLLM